MLHRTLIKPNVIVYENLHGHDENDGTSLGSKTGLNDNKTLKGKQGLDNKTKLNGKQGFLNETGRK